MGIVMELLSFYHLSLSNPLWSVVEGEVVCGLWWRGRW